jgi:hypothetical protein
MRLLQLVETRERRPKTHLLRIARIDTGHQRLHDPFAGMPSEPATKKRRQRFVVGGPTRRNQHIAAHTGKIDPG